MATMELHPEVKRRRRRKRKPAAHPTSMFDVRRPRGELVGYARDLFVNDKQVASVDEHFRSLLGDSAVQAAIGRDPIPIPATVDREGYFGDRHLSYWLSGYEDLRIVRSVVPKKALRRVLDFGGATGRFARHASLANPTGTVTIADLNVNHVAWVEKYFGPSVRAVKVSPFPHLPIADSSITLCVAFSVFTHIDSYESGWLAEIHRTLARRGFAVLTIHSEHLWPRLADRPGLLCNLRMDPRFDQIHEAGCEMPSDRLVFAYRPNSIEYNCNVFFHTDYIRKCWGRWFEIIDIKPLAHDGFQTVVFLRKTGR
jgi:ubiquinone/menaquinone biosynthesis C-methylase UbiE